MKRPVVISLGVLILVACLCLSLIGLGGAGTALVSSLDLIPPAPTLTAVPTLPGPTAPAETSVPTAAVPTTPQVETPTLQATPAPTLQGKAIPPEIARQMDEIQQQVIALRGLSPTSPVPRQLLTRGELEQDLAQDFFAAYTPEEAQQDVLVLSELGLLPAGFDLYDFYQELYAEQITGYYDNQSKTMYVISDAKFGGLERMTFAHEYTHALQDQNYDIENGLQYSEEKCKDEGERCAGVQVLIEGDASFIEQNWFLADSTAQDKADIQDEVSSYSSPVYDSAPAYMQEDFMFPYRYGLEFVQSLYDQGGWVAVNNAYLNPPVSTEQILHPDRYPEDQPVNVDIPDLSATLGAGWEKVDQSPLGEWYSYLVLAEGENENARLSPNQARLATSHWAGDSYAVYEDSQSGDTALVLLSAWDTPEDASTFAQAFTRYGIGRWGAPVSQTATRFQWTSAQGMVLFVEMGSRTAWIMAPEIQTAQAMLDQLQ